MKYNILVLGKNASLLTDFIHHSEPFFNTVSTTDYLPDVLSHFKFFKPDGFVCFLDDEYERTLSAIRTLKNDSAYNGAPIFVVASSKICDIIEETSMATVNVVVRRPITQDNLTLKITRCLEGVRDAKAKMKAYEQAKQARQEEVSAKAEESAARKTETATSIFDVESLRKHILVVDDDRTILKMLKTALSEKYDVTTMANGLVVDKFLETKYVDLIILDYEMPVETGADVFRKIKKNPRTENIPVCFLTGVTERSKILEVMALKPHGYLLKPIDMDMLMSTISDLTS